MFRIMLHLPHDLVLATGGHTAILIVMDRKLLQSEKEMVK